MPTRSRTLLAGFMWTYGVQLATVVAQLAYAATTSRLADSVDFGAYGVALSASALIALVATGGVAQGMGRLARTDTADPAALSVVALLFGGVGAIVLFVTAPWWAALWGASEAVTATRVMAISVLTAPLAGAFTGLLRRLGRFRRAALTALVANLTGMAVGVATVMAAPSAAALVVSAVVASALTALGTGFAVRTHLRQRPTLSIMRSHLTYSRNMIGMRLLSYGSGNVGRWTVSNVLGVGALGQWNRADALTSVPLQQLQTSTTSVIYPEFRHASESPERARHTWTDLLSLLAWVWLPLAGIAAAATPLLIPVLFGPGWEAAAQLAPAVVVATSIQALTSTLSSAHESLGKFTWLRLTLSGSLLVNCLGAVGVWISNQWWPIMVALVLATVTQHGIGVMLSSRHGYLQGAPLARNYTLATSVGALIFLSAWGPVRLMGLDTKPFAGLLIVAAVTLVWGALAWLNRARLVPLTLAKKYGALSPGAVPEGDTP
ncbi:oligosaccharide flippase family protein [Demequina sediminicola]|uniref:oligosaccharide flippase family protein n=1 Tax=Demequina sediminicola TaxID=1095026 RepID=UPI000785AAD8|nr:oligosaccharide flippase family protein [Demequina sediminicola]